MGYAVRPASLVRYHDHTLAPHAQALRDLERNHADQALPAFPRGLAANGTADLVKTVNDRLGRVLGDAVQHAASSQTRLAETARRYSGAEAVNLSYFTGGAPDSGTAATPSPCGARRPFVTVLHDRGPAGSAGAASYRNREADLHGRTAGRALTGPAGHRPALGERRRPAAL